MPALGWVALTLVLAVALDWGLKQWAKANPQPEGTPQVRVLGVYSPVITWLRYWRLPAWRIKWFELAQTRVSALVAAEVMLVAVWALWVGRAYLDFDPQTWPLGHEFGYQIQSHHLWTSLQRCGLCALWNGSINGGSPALGDAFGSMLHPLVMLTTLLWGVIVGSKVALVGALFMAGMAQWWLGRTLGLGRVARVWSAGLAVVGGHLSARIELGAFGLVLGVAAVSLALAAAYHLAVKRTQRAAVLLAVTGALAVLSGHGYLQLGLLIWGLALVVLFLDRRVQWRSTARQFLLAIGLCALLAGIFLLPMLRFWPSVEKHGDLEFGSAQPLAYIPLNLVIDDLGFMGSDVLQKYPYPYLYSNYIGWIPLLLALLCLRVARPADEPVLLSLTTGVLLMFFLASGLPFRWLSQLVPTLVGVRHVPLFAALAVPAILALAAYAVERLVAWPWPHMAVSLRRAAPDTAWPAWQFSLGWLLVVPLAAAYVPAYHLSQVFLRVVDVSDVYAVTPGLQTSSLQWVSAPIGEHFWIEPFQQADLKLTDVVAPWWWKDRPNPLPALMIVRGEAPPGMFPSERTLAGLPIYTSAERHYAYVETASGQVACTAAGHGGDLTITCPPVEAGTLVVQENAWPGWHARRGTEAAVVRPGRWLQIDLPAGRHIVELRYRPWDVFLGLALSILGVMLAARVWLRSAAPTSVIAHG